MEQKEEECKREKRDMEKSIDKTERRIERTRRKGGRKEKAKRGSFETEGRRTDTELRTT